MPLAQAPTLCHPAANALVHLSHWSLWFVDSRGAIEGRRSWPHPNFLGKSGPKTPGQLLISRHFVGNKIVFKLLTSLQPEIHWETKSLPLFHKRNHSCNSRSLSHCTHLHSHHFENESYLVVLIITLSFFFVSGLPNHIHLSPATWWSC